MRMSKKSREDDFKNSAEYKRVALICKIEKLVKYATKFRSDFMRKNKMCNTAVDAMLERAKRMLGRLYNVDR